MKRRRDSLGRHLRRLLLGSLLPAALAPGFARAAVGAGASGPAAIDTVAPVVSVDPLPAFLLVQGGQTVTFHWTTADAHPGATADKFTAAVLADTTTLAALEYFPDVNDYTWAYVAPEISSGNVRVRVRCVDAFGNATIVQGDAFSVILSTSDAPLTAVPTGPRLEGNLPNPCNPGTTVRFSVPQAQHVVLDLHAADGSLVRRLADATFDGGRHEIFWDGRDAHGRDVASGTYLLRLSADGAPQTRKIALVR